MQWTQGIDKLVLYRIYVLVRKYIVTHEAVVTIHIVFDHMLC